MDIRTEFTTIDSRRKALGMSAKDLCARAGISQATYCNLRIRENFNTNTIKYLNMALDVAEKEKKKIRKRTNNN